MPNVPYCCNWSTWKAHTPGIPALVVEDMLMTSGELEPMTVKKFTMSPELNPIVAGLPPNPFVKVN